MANRRIQTLWDVSEGWLETQMPTFMAPKEVGQMPSLKLNRLPKTNSHVAPENTPSQKGMVVFQPSIFRCKLLVSGSVYIAPET